MIQKLLLRQRTNYAVTSFFSLLLGLLLLSACNGNKPDISDIALEVPIDRFEQAFFAIDSSNYKKDLEQLQQKYPNFFPLYVEKLVGLLPMSDPVKRYEQQLLQFTTNPDIRALNDSCQQKYPTLKQLENELTTAFKYYKYYFPEKPVPKVVSHVSEFGPAVATFEDKVLAISLDMFLGKDFVFYPSVSLPDYIIARLSPEYIAPTAMKAYVQGLYEFSSKDKRAIDQIAYEGKLMYFLDMVLPDTADELKMGYNQEQLAWCKKNEVQMWEHLSEQELLFSSKQREIDKLVGEAPFTSGMPRSSPGRVGIWIGWQMIRKLMADNPNLSFEELMAMTDGAEVLRKSKYKPK